MLERANALLRHGDVAAARLIYLREANRGVAEGALAMARTYDPEFLATIPTAGLQPDIAKARDWYRKAGDLGNAQARKRLSILEGAQR